MKGFLPDEAVSGVKSDRISIFESPSSELNLWFDRVIPQGYRSSSAIV
ncbi:MAG: hypothetical protein IGS48_13305 [Oscillatoriales cyanobacterium C42_A2020_001]|nr:hypothetical protein [Leptolyngbyaceae cyanobacterium C42_A2020_001]